MDLFKERTASGLERIVVDNGALRVALLPEYGGNIWSVVDRATGLEALWHHPSQEPRRTAENEAYDDVFFGGWHEMFPSDIEEKVAGRQMRDHGELWPLVWAWAPLEQNGALAGVRLEARCMHTKASAAKTIRMASDARTFSVDYELVNLESEPLDFMFKLHAAAAIDEGDRILLPARTALLAADEGSRSRLAQGNLYDWPAAMTGSGLADLSAVRERDSKIAELWIAADLSEGSCGIHRRRHGMNVLWEFDPASLPSVWLFAAYGGWRDLYTAILEPATGYPLGLNEAKRSGVIQSLAPGGVYRTRVHFRMEIGSGGGRA